MKGYKPISVVITTVTNYGGGGGGGGARAPLPIPTPMYSTTALAPSIIIDDARRELFTKSGCSSSNQSSSYAVRSLPRWSLLGQHAGHAKLGIGQSKNWKPLWTTLPETRVSSRELLCCGCKKGCTAGRKKAALNCTALCQCGGECDIYCINSAFCTY